jgi:hypothetical protein
MGSFIVSEAITGKDYWQIGVNFSINGQIGPKGFRTLADELRAASEVLVSRIEACRDNGIEEAMEKVNRVLKIAAGVEF